MVKYVKTKNEIIKLKEEILKDKERKKKIESMFQFIVPDYIIDEIIYREHRSDKENIFALINLAVLNNRITKEQGKIIKNKIKEIGGLYEF